MPKYSSFGARKRKRAAVYFGKSHPLLPCPTAPPPLQIPSPPPSPPPPPLTVERVEEDDDPEDENDSWMTKHVNRMLVSRYFTEVLISPPRRE